MSINVDYYKVLGLVPSAENIVIKAAYRALVSVYHPDKNPTSDAEEKIRQINIAYEVLSDTSKRKQYDVGRQPQEHNASPSEFEDVKPFTTDPLEKSWAIAVSFYPNIEHEHKDLEKISWRLGFVFKLLLLEEQNYSGSSEIAQKLKIGYLSRYFGKDSAVLEYAEHLIKAHEIQAALYVNEVVSVMGRSVTALDITTKVNERFPSVQQILNMRILYSQIKEKGVSAATTLINLHGGSVIQTRGSENVVLNMNDQQLSFRSGVEFCNYVYKLYADSYA